MIESLNIYSNSEKKVGFWPRVKNGGNHEQD
jgi:hypothetical protein